MNVIFTAVFGKPDRLCEPPTSTWDKICFTDLGFAATSQYQIVSVKFEDPVPRKRQRRVKIYWPDILDNYEYSFYLDSNVRLGTDPAEFIKFLEPGSDILVYRHPCRTCLYGEAEVCVAAGFADPDLTKKQVSKYRREGYPERNGLFACTVILRRHTEKIKYFSKDWWEEVEQFSKRDQISFPYLVWKQGLKVSTFPKGTLYDNPWFEWKGHNAKSGHFRGTKQS